MTATKNHTYPALAEDSQQLKTNSTENHDVLLRQNDSEKLVSGEQLLSQAEELLQAVPSSDALEMPQIPQVRLERGQDRNLERTVDIEVTRSHRNFPVSMIKIDVILNCHAAAKYTSQS